MHIHLLFTQQLQEAASEADRLRETARKLMIEAVADAHQAGMTQREIAAGLGRSQPEVSRLLRLADPRFVPRSDLGRHLVKNRRAVLAAMHTRGATNVRVFGSLASYEDNQDSDIDLLVDIPDDFTLLDLSDLQLTAESILGVKTDVVPARGLKGKIRSASLRQAIAL